MSQGILCCVKIYYLNGDNLQKGQPSMNIQLEQGGKKIKSLNILKKN
jgi:hypothetical protein